MPRIPLAPQILAGTTIPYAAAMSPPRFCRNVERRAGPRGRRNGLWHAEGETRKKRVGVKGDRALSAGEPKNGKSQHG